MLLVLLKIFNITSTAANLPNPTISGIMFGKQANKAYGNIY